MGESLGNANIRFRDIETLETDVRCLATCLGELSEHVANLKNFNTRLKEQWTGTDASVSYFNASDLDVQTLESLCNDVLGGQMGLCAVLKDHINKVLYSASGGTAGE